MTRDEKQIIDKLLEARLPCSVSLPPATVIHKGCRLETLIVALQMRGLTSVLLDPLPDGPEAA